MIGSILKRVTKVKPANLAITRGIITETGAIQKMPQGINKFSPIAVGFFCVILHAFVL